ncbi:MAG: hypothetical protein IPN82_08145 [Chitinophagaceae bacterium]|nr:hypothetical protein [Chitinophagaceae bacterium]
MRKTLGQIILTAICTLLTVIAFSQNKSAVVSGKVVDDNENPLANVSVTILGQSKATFTNDSAISD